MRYHPVLYSNTYALFGNSWTCLGGLIHATASGIFTDYDFYTAEQINNIDVGSQHD